MPRCADPPPLALAGAGLQDVYRRALRAEAKALGRFEAAEKRWRACQRQSRAALAALRAARMPSAVPTSARRGGPDIETEEEA